MERLGRAYNEDQILDLRRHDKVRLPEDLWKTIRDFGISSCPPTHRGKRAGRRKQRKIKTLSSSQRTQQCGQHGREQK